MNYFKDKKVLVTGGSGFVGTNLIIRLLSLGASVRATLHENKSQLKFDQVDFRVGDLRDECFCNSVCQDIDFVFLCAANTSGAAVMEKRPLVHLTPNIIMNTLMLEAAYAAGVKKTLFISSNTVYPVSDEPVKEEDCNNTFFYKYFIVAWMKRFSEIMCEMYSKKIKKPMACLVVRPANLYGPMDDFEWETSHVLPALIRRVIERHSPISVWGDGQDIKDFLYIDDFIDGILLVMENQDTFEPVNLASGQGYRLCDLLNMLCEIDGYTDARIEYDASKPTMIPTRIIDSSLAYKLFGFNAKTSIRDGLTETVEWYRKKTGVYRNAR